MSTPQVFTIGIKGVVVRDGKALILLGKTSGGRAYWDVPGCRIDVGEVAIEDALRREIREELPGTVFHGIERPLFAGFQSIGDGQPSLFLLFYLVKASVPEDVLSSEHSERRWIGVDDIPQLRTTNPSPEQELYFEAVRRALD